MQKALFSMFLFSLLFVLLFGCTVQSNSALNSSEVGAVESVSIEERCVNSCLAALDKGSDLSAGPCLGLIATDWVCDVAHSPRIASDDLPANTCPDFASGAANHFVEVDTSCKVIQTY